MSEKDSKTVHNDHKYLTEQEVERIVDKKVLETKLTITESRLNHFFVLAGVFLTIFGIIVPLFWSFNSSEKTEKAIDRMAVATDKAIAQMKDDFQKLAGTALRKPILDCFVDGKRLEGGVLRLGPSSRRSRTIEIRNHGDAPAKNMQVRFYHNLNAIVSEDWNLFGGSWAEITSDEPNFQKESRFHSPFDPLDPKDKAEIPIGLVAVQSMPTNSTALLKIFYEQTEPIQIGFTIVVSDKD
ncbi:MAG: hypothetical protein WCH84_01990 [Verrucomicrobiota bacterium]